ncbi:subtilisin family serine protease [Anaerobacterium chartisolvens]|uniref:Subtilisin family serine protease n=1 Tax=Anaerobacterium chartisolvens TaxID=1297424 RepID=A0A369B1B7_9FIRM|nr:Ig-like domain-containing protein [Anaerobacterium chartisolvens]RCX15462.1 subtilisin family serine protease [Anaerobacterium chartisolvens]
MTFLKKGDKKGHHKLWTAISIFTLLTFFLSSVFSFNTAFAQQYSEPEALSPHSQQSYKIIVKLNNETAAEAEAQISQKSMALQRSNSKNTGDIFSRYKIKSMEPVYKGLVGWKKKTGKTEAQYYNKIQRDFTKRFARSRDNAKAEGVELSNTYVVEADVGSRQEYEELLELLKKDPRFEYAEENIVMSIDMTPNDPYFLSRRSWGQPFDDLYGVKLVSCPEAWDTAMGEGVTVAVVDTGIDNTHPDILDNIWTNTGEIPNNGIDDDNNGYIDDIWGWNFVNGSNNPEDDQGHGTHVSGTIAASGNNGVGIIGVAPGARVMAVKSLNSQGLGDALDLARGIVYAAENGADIINCSFGGSGYSQILEEAVIKAVELGAVVVVSAGNKNDNAGEYYPAGIKEAITVAAVDNMDQRAYFSNWGSCIDVAAPGVDILSLRAARAAPGASIGSVVGDKYVTHSGTSMAAPHVAGIAALILSNNREMSNAQISSALKSSADDIMSEGFDYYSGYGRVNAGKALQINSSIQAEIESPSHGSSVKSSIEVTGSAKGSGFSGYTLECGKIIEYGQDPAYWSIIGQGDTEVDGGKLGDLDLSGLADGRYVIRLSVRDNSIPQKRFVNRVEIEVDQIGFTAPEATPDPSYASGIRPGRVIDIQGFAAGQTFSSYSIEWGEGLNPTEWNTEGITLEGGGSLPVSGGALGKWDSGVCSGKEGYYQLRLLVENDGFTNEERTIVYLQPDLASDNWPKKIDVPLAENSGVLPSDSFTGKNSLVGIYSLQPKQTFFAKHSHDGTLEYKLPFVNVAHSQVAVGDIDDLPGEETVFVRDDMLCILKGDNSYTEFALNSEYDFRNNPVILKDLDGDYVPEIMVLGVNRSNSNRALYAYRLDGSILGPKFPLIAYDDSRRFDTMMYVNFLVFDINNDGENEIITQQMDDGYITTLNIYRWDGTPLNWQQQQPSFAKAQYVRNMIGGDIDGDGLGEIVIWAGGLNYLDIQYIYVINSDGSVRSGWPYAVPDSKLDMAIADMDRDGTDEIVYSQLNEINVLRIDGTPMSNAWPIYRERYYGNFSIGDINGDGYPEIVAYRISEKEYVSWDSERRKYVHNEVVAIDRNARTAGRWRVIGPGGARPDKSLTGSYYSTSSPVLGDFDGDGRVDIAVAQALWDEKDVITGGALAVIATGGDYSADNMDWPVRLHNTRNTSVNIAEGPLPDVTGIALNTASASVTAGKKIKLAASVTPAGASKSIVWSVREESTGGVAEVAQDGTVTARLPGTAVIRAASRSNLSKYAECAVTVAEAPEGVLFEEGFESSGGSLFDGWSVQHVSGDRGVWSVVSNGNTPVVDAPRSGAKMAKFNSYDVAGAVTRLYRDEGVSLDDGSHCLKFWMYHDMITNPGSSIQVQVTTDGGRNWVNVGNAIDRYDGSSGWKEYILSLDEYRGASCLQIAFTATGNRSGNMYLDDISLIKSVPVSDITLDRNSMSLAMYRQSQLNADIHPHNVTDKNVIWGVQSESADRVVVVSSTGSVLAQNRGWAIVRATSVWDPRKYADCVITVNTELVPVTGLSLNTGSADISAGESVQLEAVVLPQNATNRNVRWTVEGSDNAATVSATGLVTAKAEGTAVIRATSTFDSSKYAECTVTVGSQAVPVTGVSLDTESLSIAEGQSQLLTAQVMPENATNREVVWTVQSESADDVATVSASGLVTAISAGTAVIRAASAANPSIYAECTLTVNIPVIPVTRVSLDTESLSMAEGQSRRLTAQVMPENATNRQVVWTVQSESGDNVAAVSETGLVTAIGAGTAVIRAASAANPSIYAECTVTVTLPGSVTAITLNKTSLSMSRYKLEQLVATVEPENAANKAVIWTVQSENASNVVMVLQTGSVNSLNYGTAVVRATSAADPSIYAECTVTVNPPGDAITGVSLNKAAVTLEGGQSQQLVAAVAPASSVVKGITWRVISQSRDNVAAVSETGLVTANNPGTAVIRAVSVGNPDKYAECTVTVIGP